MNQWLTYLKITTRFVEIEERLSTYLLLRSMIFIRGDVKGCTWAKLKQTCVKWGANELKEFQSQEEENESSDMEKGRGLTEAVDGNDTDSAPSAKCGVNEKPEKKYSDFRASPGWLHKVLKRNNIEVSVIFE